MCTFVFHLGSSGCGVYTCRLGLEGGEGGLQREGEGKKIQNEERMKLENSIHHVLLSSTVR